MSWILPGLEDIPQGWRRAKTIGEPDPKQKVNARRARWRALNPEKAKVQWTTWNRKPEVRARKKIWVALHKVHLAKMQRDRRARMREVLS